MRFAHTADCHLGGHRHPKLRALTHQAFARFVDETIAENVDFCLIAGDLFNSSIPGIETLRFAVEQLVRLRDRDIPVYLIPGSHDYSPNGKTMIDVLAEAGLIVNVAKGTEEDGKYVARFTKDAKTGAHITGVLGMRGMLDLSIHRRLVLEEADAPRIFLFHTLIEELSPKHMKNLTGGNLSMLPRGCMYYAGGHVHTVASRPCGEGVAAYPGPLFPNSFSELEELTHGGFFLYDDGELVRKDIVLKQVISHVVDCEGKTPAQVNAALDLLQASPESIVLLRLTGTLHEGSPSGIMLRETIARLSEHAYVVLRNTSALSAPSFHEVAVQGETQDIEAAMLEEHREQLSIAGTDGVSLTRALMHCLGREAREGEKVYEYQETITAQAKKEIERAFK